MSRPRTQLQFWNRAERVPTGELGRPPNHLADDSGICAVLARYPHIAFAIGSAHLLCGIFLGFSCPATIAYGSVVFGRFDT